MALVLLGFGIIIVAEAGLCKIYHAKHWKKGFCPNCQDFQLVNKPNGKWRVRRDEPCICVGCGGNFIYKGKKKELVINENYNEDESDMLIVNNIELP